MSSRSSHVRLKVVALLGSMTALWAFAAFVTVREGLNLLSVSTLDSGVGRPTVALLSQHDAGSSEMLLRLGASGVRQVVDVTSPSGWNRLRMVVGQPATRAVSRIQAPILKALGRLLKVFSRREDT